MRSVTGWEVKLCPSPDGEETFVLCRSRDRREKEKAMHGRFERRIEEGLRRIEATCQKQRLEPVVVAQRVGRLLGQNSRAAALFQTEIQASPDGRATLRWKKIESWRDWAAMSEGCYLLRSNVKDWSDEDLWKAYIQLTEAEAAFSHSQERPRAASDLAPERGAGVGAHPGLLPGLCALEDACPALPAAGLGHEPRRVFEELDKIQLVDVVLPTREGTEIRRRCVTQPTDHQALLLAHLGPEPSQHPLTDGM